MQLPSGVADGDDAGGDEAGGDEEVVGGGDATGGGLGSGGGEGGDGGGDGCSGGATPLYVAGLGPSTHSSPSSMLGGYGLRTRPRRCSAKFKWSTGDTLDMKVAWSSSVPVTVTSLHVAYCCIWIV